MVSAAVASRQQYHHQSQSLLLPVLSLLSCSYIAIIAIVPVVTVTSYSISPVFLSRIIITPSYTQSKESLKTGVITVTTGSTLSTLLYSSNPPGRKRRRRKDSTDDIITSTGSNIPSDESTSDEFDDISTSTTTMASDSNELPDFDIPDEDELPATLSTTRKNSRSSTPTTVDPLIGTITANMMASSSPLTNRAVVSVNELRDRSLEQKLESLYDKPSSSLDEDEELPDLLTLQRERKKITTTEDILLSSTASSLSKKERQTLARQQQDMEQQSKKALSNDDNDDTNLLSKLPFVTNENGKFEPLKLLEAATWTCIIALVVWEVYINSPLFTRAAPIIPIVYDIWI